MILIFRLSCLDKKLVDSWNCLLIKQLFTVECCRNEVGYKRAR
jgi:hypothetical protein